jgi:hypothetical protein
MAKIKKQNLNKRKYSMLRVYPETNKQLKFISQKSSLYVIEIIAELVADKFDAIG